MIVNHQERACLLMMLMGLSLRCFSMNGGCDWVVCDTGHEPMDLSMLHGDWLLPHDVTSDGQRGLTVDVPDFMVF